MIDRSARVPLACCLLLHAMGGGTIAQQPASPAQALIDFSVLGADGRPVLDLTARDVTLKVGGRPREITYFELVRADAAKPAPPDAPLPRPFATNVRPMTAGRDVLVIIDEESIAPAKLARAQDAIRYFVTTLGTSGRVVLLSPRQGGPRIDLGDTSTDVRSALARFSAATSMDPQFQACRTITTLQSLQAFFNAYRGRFTPTVVFVSGGIAAPPKDGQGFVAMGAGKCPLGLKDFHDAGAAARVLKASVYVLYAPELTLVGTPDTATALGLETLAGTLGGDFLHAGSAADGLARIARETAAYYLIGFDTHPDDRAGALQRVELSVARDRVKVRYRNEVVGSNAPPAPGKRLSPDDMLRVADAHRDLPLQAAAFPSRTDDGKIRLVVLFEPVGAGAKLKGAAVGLYDVKGRLTRWTAEGGDLGKSPALAGIIVPAGTYRMRVAAVDAAGRAGTVDGEVTAELVEAPPVKLSGMLLGVSDAQGAFSPRLQFAGENGAFAYLEIYGVPKGADVKVVQEVAATPDGPALVSSPVPLTAGATADARIAYGGFAIDGLPPGDVVMRALVTVDGKPVGRAVRTLRKVR